MSKIVIITGSPSSTSRLYALTDYVSNGLLQLGHEVQHIHVNQLPAEALIHAKFDNESIQEANHYVEQAQGVIIC